MKYLLTVAKTHGKAKFACENNIQGKQKKSLIFVLISYFKNINDLGLLSNFKIYDHVTTSEIHVYIPYYQSYRN